MSSTTTLTAPAGCPDAAIADRITVLIADDHPLFRRGMARAVARHPRLELVAEAADGREALELIELLDPAVAVLDHRMPGLSGVEVCAELRRSRGRPATAVLLLSAFEDRDIVSAAVRAGAAGYVGKTASQGEICDAVERVGRGGIAFTAATLEGANHALGSGRGDD